jgi:cation diffusion facilitator family transporter
VLAAQFPNGAEREIQSRSFLWNSNAGVAKLTTHSMTFFFSFCPISGYTMGMNQDYSGMMRAVKVSLISNAVLFLIKGVTFFIVNSLAIAADFGISAVSLAISFLLFYAIRMSNRPADLLHNYGYGKIENVSEAIEGVILIGLALAMTVQAMMHLVNPGVVSSPFVGLAASAIGIVINFWGSSYILGLAKKHSSPALRAEGIHFRLEGLISTAITASFTLVIILVRMGFSGISHYVDPVATITVSVVITIPSVRLLKEAFMKLLDASISEGGQMDVIKVLTRHYDKYCNFKHIKTRTGGRKQFVDIHLVMPDHISVKAAHGIAGVLKNDLTDAIEESEVVIHIEPCEKNCAYAKKGENCPYLE